MTVGLLMLAPPEAAALTDSAAMASPQKIAFLDLPLETQKQVFTYLSQRDLLANLTVSPHFFTLAAAQLYRVLDFKLTNSDTVDEGGWSMRTAEALQTVVASDYNYGQHIKSFRITMVDENTQSSLVMSRFLWDRAGFASKTLNTSLLLLLKRATMLESFLWDVPIELSGAVYQALQRIQGLRQLRLRLDVSLFSNLKLILHAGPLPGSSGISNHPPSTNMSSSFPSLPPLNSNNALGTLPGPKGRTPKKKRVGQSNFWAGNRELSGFKQLSSLSLLGISSLDYLDEISGCLKASTTSLKSLALSLSHETAQKARKVSAAAPPPVDDATSDDEEDDELIDPPTPPPPPPATTPLPALPTRTEADVRKEKQAQEAILAKIFDMEQQNNRSKKLERNLILSTSKQDPQNGINNALRDVKAIAQKLSEVGSGDPNDPSTDRETIEMVHKATAQYLNKNPAVSKGPSSGKSVSSSFTETTAPPKALPSVASSALPEIMALAQNLSSSKSGGASDPVGSSINWDVYKAIQDIAKNKDIDLNSLLEEAINGHGGDSISPWTPPGASSLQDHSQSNAPSGFSSPGATTPLNELEPSLSHPKIQQLALFNKQLASSGLTKGQNPPDLTQNSDLMTQQNGSKTPPASAQPDIPPPAAPTNQPTDDSGDVDMSHPDEDPSEVIADQEMISDEEENGEEDVEEAGMQSPRKRVRFEALKKAEGMEESEATASQTNGHIGIDDANPEQEQSPEEVMQAWIREAHGYQLEEVKLHWIPIRAGILSRAIDLSVLKRITLLNCGSQDGFWMILAGFQARQGTIAIKSIHTDNVSKSFLRFLKSFEGLTELFMHERKKNQSEAAAASSQPKLSVTEIRRQGLRKHIRTLKRLMIKNEHDSSWDLDAVTITLLSTKGSSLIELAVGLGALPFHQLMQNLSALKSLQALHLLAIRGSTDVTLSHLEYLNVVVDNLSHHQSMRVKYVAIDNIISMIQRRSMVTTRKIRQAKAKRHHSKLEREKGKGKEKEGEVGFASDASSETDFPDDKDLHDLYAMKLKASMIVDMRDVEQHAKIFQNEFRAGAF
ncbi:MAG: hypothetical protein Q9216_001355 [Gyalolechia sp. 2 TL-2023]